MPQAPLLYRLLSTQINWPFIFSSKFFQNVRKPLPNFYRQQTKFAKVMFLHVSVILSRGGSPGPHLGRRLTGLAWGKSPSTHPGVRLRGLAGWRGLQAHTQGEGWGVWLGGLQVCTRGCIPACTEADTPSPSRRLLLRAVRILLICILVTSSFWIKHSK